MGWMGKLVGGTIGFALGGPLGAIFGAAFGHAFDAGSELDGRAQTRTGGPDGQGLSSIEKHQLTFFVAAFSPAVALTSTAHHSSLLYSSPTSREIYPKA